MKCPCRTKNDVEEELNTAPPDEQQQTDNPQMADTPPPITKLQNSFHRRHLPQSCVAFSSPEGRKLFEAINSSTNYMQIYFPLAEQFTTQAEPAYCGLSTLSMCLNALQIDPGRLWKGPWRWFSEELFDCCTSLSVAKERGISMSEFICLARCNGVLTEDYRATSDFTLEQFREIVKRSCATSSEIVVLNYSRKVLMQTGDGHFSPIGGYHAERDMVLLMDVARFKYPPHWVKLSRVFKAMSLVVKAMNKPRGLVILRAAPPAEHYHPEEQTGTPVAPAPQSCCYSMSAVQAARRTASHTATMQR
ncbi:Phytochelatin synthase [Phytophthora infestans]|uniref:glutathione gamma-glutamylcysteinyltransferase n=1 Tax=Phytophthora infestans TaxID=4787 RepID=A0A8S9UKR0_PHYIN|nr:Phytochelatin synthase [Phytophthora infestans]